MVDPGDDVVAAIIAPSAAGTETGMSPANIAERFPAIRLTMLNGQGAQGLHRPTLL
jgi:hypothetical protein